MQSTQHQIAARRNIRILASPDNKAFVSMFFLKKNIHYSLYVFINTFIKYNCKFWLTSFFVNLVGFSDNWQSINLTLQTQHVYSTLKWRWNDRFHVVSTWNTCGVFVGNEIKKWNEMKQKECEIFFFHIRIVQ